MWKNAILFLGTCLLVVRAADEIDSYKKLIEDKLKQAKNFQDPVDASVYKPLEEEIEDYGLYDFVIVGAGSAGCVLANRLTESGEWKVLLLEAGKWPDKFTMIPSYFAVNTLTDYNWGYRSTPQENACLGNNNRECRLPRGKGIGGNSLLAELVYVRGDPINYDRWASMVKDSTWSYENVLPYFKKSENFQRNNPKAPVEDEYHGQLGPLTVNYHMPQSNLSDVFLAANEELGYKIVDYNGRQQVGATIMQINTKNGRRLDQGTAFIKPVSDRDNLMVSDESFVIKVDINQVTKETKGVVFTKQNKTYYVGVRKEVIISAGPIASPQLLMLSGVGPKTHLKNMEIPLVKHLEVGSTLRDHVFVGVQFSTNETIPIQNLEQQIEGYLKGYGDLTASNTISGAGFYQTQIEEVQNYPDLEIVLSTNPVTPLAQKFLNWNDEIWNTLFNLEVENPVMLTPVLLHSRSVGSLRLKSRSPFDYPLIDLNLLSDPENKDMETLYEGIKIVLALYETNAFQSIAAKLEAKPISACSKHEFLSKDYWLCYIRHVAQSAFHPMGTVPMGSNDEDAVVDSNAKVFGIQKLRVVGSSIYPHPLSGQPNVITTMVAEKIADAIKYEHSTI